MPADQPFFFWENEEIPLIASEVNDVNILNDIIRRNFFQYKGNDVLAEDFEPHKKAI